MELTYTTENALVRDAYTFNGPNNNHFVDLENGLLIYPDGESAVLCDQDTTIDDILLMSMPETIDTMASERIVWLMCGNKRRNQPVREWFQSKDWQLVSFQNEKMLEAVYKKKMCTIIVKNAGTYFGEVKSEEMRMVRYAYHTLEYMLQREFKGFRRLYSTPASTGRKLIEMSLPENRRYERLDDKSCEFLKVNFGQGRVEVFNQAIINDEKVEYKYIGNGGMDRVDGRLMYGACMSHLPVGQCTHEISCEVYMSYTQDDKVFPLYPGFYRVEFMPPSDWKHIGLLPVRLSYDKMCYPNVSGCFHESYCTGEELAVAIENKWHCFVKESWLWRDTQKITDPLATWKKKIMKCYDATENTYIKSAIRRIILHTLGSFVQFNDIKERVTFRPTFIELGKIGARNLEKIVRSRAETITWLENVPLPPSRQKWVHPEWSRMAWGRARARVARMALKIPFKYIVGIMTDEILCCDLPKEIKEQIFIDDTHRPGSFRIKGKIDGSMLWPQTPLELRMILERENIKDETRT